RCDSRSFCNFRMELDKLRGKVFIWAAWTTVLSSLRKRAWKISSISCTFDRDKDSVHQEMPTDKASIRTSSQMPRGRPAIKSSHRTDQLLTVGKPSNAKRMLNTIKAK